MAYSRGWFFGFFVLVGSSNNVAGHLLRNLQNSHNVDYLQDITEHEMTLSKQFQNHEGGVIDSPSGFLCLEVVKFESSNSGEDQNEVIGGFSCHYKNQGVIMTSELRDIHGVLNENFQYNRRLFLKGATYEESTYTIQITPEVQFIWLTMTTELIQTEKEVQSSGQKTVLVFHITANRVPTSGSVQELSDWVFGTSGNRVNLKSQYAACSYNQLLFTPALGRNINNGVVKVTITLASTDYYAMSNASVEYAKNTLGIDVDSFDYLMFALPRTATDNGDPITWGGVGNRPGKNSWYRDELIEFVQLSMHELGHNIGLHHSSEGGEEYGDTTCVMGSGPSNPDARRCFNAAKMKQLGWYTNREKSIDPFRQSFSGKIIGVNDYGISTPDHILVLEILYPNGVGNLYLTLNKAEGMTRNTQEYFDQIIVTQTQPDTKSVLIKHIGVGSSATIADFTGSRDLRISFAGMGSDGNVNYASVDVALVSETCTMDSDCNDLNACTSDSCQDSVCSYEITDNCCGNGICEFDGSGETCGTCTSDCSMDKGSCAAIDEPDGNIRFHITSGGITYPLDTFITNIFAKKDLAIYSIELYLRTTSESQASFINTVSIFTKLGTWFDENDSSPTNTYGWTQVFRGDVASTYINSWSSGGERHISTVELTTPVIVPGGTLQSFYIQIDLDRTDQYLYVKDEGNTFTDNTVQFDDTDITLYEGAHCEQALDYCRSTTMLFQGNIGYMYTTQAPTPIVPPTPIPSVPPTPSPTKKPTNSNSCENLSYRNCEQSACCFWRSGSCLVKPICQVHLSNSSGEISKEA